jgi:hypothetical protein
MKILCANCSRNQGYASWEENMNFRRCGAISVFFLLVSLLILAACTTPSPRAVMPTGPDVVWDLVIIGDSSLWKLGKAYAAQIEKDVGVKVVLHDFSNRYSSAGTVLKVLAPGDDQSEGLVTALRDAEVVVMFVNPMDSIDPQKPHDLEQCFLNKAPESCPPEAFEKYTADLEAIWAEIFKLRDSQPIILRATDIYNPLVRPWTLKKVLEPCTTCWEMMNNAAQMAAETYHIPFLSRHNAFNGVTHFEDPREKGYIDPDGEHPTDLMGQYTAELLSKLGYAPVTPQ